MKRKEEANKLLLQSVMPVKELLSHINESYKCCVAKRCIHVGLCYA